MSTPAKEKSLSTFRLSKAISQSERVIEPFQYYTEIGEAIYRIDQSTHANLSRLYIHLDRHGEELARVQLGPGNPTISAKQLAAQIADQPFEEIGFAQLMFEMHLAASSHPDQIVPHEAIRRLRELSAQEPILIAGCGRSGTTLLLSMLGAHPEILAIPEESYAFYPFPFRLTRLLTMVEEQNSKKTRIWCEKTPKHVSAFSEIYTAFEGQIKLIHIVRDGRDVVTSHHPNADERYYISPERWLADVSAGWQQKEKTLLIRYEDLIQQPKETLAVLCEYVGIEFDERMLQFERHSSVKGDKAWQGKQAQPLYKTQIERWRAPEHAERVTEFMASPGVPEMMALLDYK